MTTRLSATIRPPPHKRGANIIAGGIGDVQAHSLSHDEGHCLCFEFARISRLGTITGAVEQLVCILVRQHGELGCRRQARQHPNASATRESKRPSQIVGVIP
jgi:hypothetical protein